MHRGSKSWWTRGLVAALAASLLAIAACGSGDDSTPEEAAEPVARVAAPGGQGPANGGRESGSSKPRATIEKRIGQADGNVEPPAGPASSGETSRAQARPAGGTAPADQQPRRKPRAPKAKPPKLPPPGKAKVKPPSFLPGGGGDPYTVARNLCGDRQLVESVPPEYRGGAEEMARMYADIFDPENREPAYEGCLAGLRGLGY